MLKRLLILVLVLSHGAWADDLLSPAEAVKKFTAPEGFRVDLLASEPDVVQPIAFCWDGRGRLWVVEGRTYPGRKNNQPPGGDSGRPGEAQLADIFGGDDRILIFADEDGDGSFESRKVFAEKLHLVSGIEIGHGGVYVGAAPYLLHILDRDGDDRPDGAPEILLDGWGWQDTHETLNSFVWGPDGWLYGCHGVFTHSNVGVPGTPKEQRVPINCHYWRFHPVRRTFEAYASGTSNSWGFDYNAAGDWFAEACVIPHFWHIIEGAYYLRQSNPLGHFNPYVYTNIETIADHLHYIGNTPHSGNGVSDAAGGGHAHCGLLIYHGHNFPAEYRGRAMMFNIHGQRINQEQLVPEGSGYVAKHLPDFVKANDRNFSGVALKVGPDGAVYFIDWYDAQKCHRTQPEVWDRSNGRIYRVRYEKTWKPWRGDVAKLSEADVTAGIAAGNGWLERMVAQRRRESGQWPAAPRVASVEWAREAAGDARSRLKLASALQKLPLEQRWPVAELLLSHGEDAGDHNLPQMYWYAVEPLVAADPGRALELAGKSAIPLVAQHMARRLAEIDGGVGHLVRAMGREKTGAGLVLLLKAARDGLKGRVGVAMPSGWDGAWENMDDVVARRTDGKEHAAEIADLRSGLAVAFGDRRAFPGLRGQVRDRALEVERRIQALQVLAQGDDPELAALVKELLDDPAMRLAALRVLPRALR